MAHSNSGIRRSSRRRSKREWSHHWLSSLLIDSSIQRTLSSFAKRHAWAFSQGALIAPSLPSLLSVALLDDLIAVARMSSAINFFLGRPLRSAGAAISGSARGLLQRTGAGACEVRCHTPCPQCPTFDVRPPTAPCPLTTDPMPPIQKCSPATRAAPMLAGHSRSPSPRSRPSWPAAG